MSFPATGRKKKAMAAIKVQASASDLQSFSSLPVTFLVVRKKTYMNSIMDPTPITISSAVTSYMSLDANADSTAVITCAMKMHRFHLTAWCTDNKTTISHNQSALCRCLAKEELPNTQHTSSGYI